MTSLLSLPKDVLRLVMLELPQYDKLMFIRVCRLMRRCATNQELLVLPYSKNTHLIDALEDLKRQADAFVLDAASKDVRLSGLKHSFSFITGFCKTCGHSKGSNAHPNHYCPYIHECEYCKGFNSTDECKPWKLVARERREHMIAALNLKCDKCNHQVTHDARGCLKSNNIGCKKCRDFKCAYCRLEYRKHADDVHVCELNVNRWWSKVHKPPEISTKHKRSDGLSISLRFKCECEVGQLSGIAYKTQARSIIRELWVTSWKTDTVPTLLQSLLGSFPYRKCINRSHETGVDNSDVPFVYFVESGSAPDESRSVMSQVVWMLTVGEVADIIDEYVLTKADDLKK